MDKNLYNEAVNHIRSCIGDFRPEVLLILGSGLGYLGDEVENSMSVSYSDIPGFMESTADGHEGKLVFGRFSGRNVVIMKGRLHYYEGYTPEEIIFPIRVAKLLGAGSMIITNAAGAVNTDYKAGELMMLDDIIKLTGDSPLRGQNNDEFGVRFPDMSHIFDQKCIDEAMKMDLAISVHHGVYFYMPGPQYETPAEIRAIRVLGGDAVGMSTVYECIAARHAGMKICGVTLLSNMAAGILNQPLTSEEVIEASTTAAPEFSKLIKKMTEII